MSSMNTVSTKANAAVPSNSTAGVATASTRFHTLDPCGSMTTGLGGSPGCGLGLGLITSITSSAKSASRLSPAPTTQFLASVIFFMIASRRSGSDSERLVICWATSSPTPTATSMAVPTTAATAGVRPNPRRCSQATAGLSTNVRKMASATGMRIDRAK